MPARLQWKVSKLSPRHEAVWACALGLSFFFLLCGFSNAYFFVFNVIPGREVRATAWSDGHTWNSTECTVVASGIAYRGGCARQDETTDPLNAPKAFISPASFSECPGTSWCADDGEACACSGQVRFAHATYATTKAGDDARSIVVNSSGSVLCSKSESGPFFEDPNPGRRKACFCTPQAILQKMDGRNPHERSCRSVVDKEYEAPQVRRLKPKQRSLAEIEGLDGSGNVCYVLYLPWALVEVNGHLRCAYEYGVPAASLMQDRSQAESTLKRINRRSFEKVECFVSDTTKNACAVALRPPEQLVCDEEDHDKIDRVRLVVCLVVFCLCWIPCCWLLVRSSDEELSTRLHWRTEGARPLLSRPRHSEI